MSIYELLKQDHDEVLSLMDKLVALKSEDVEERDLLVAEVRDALIPHSRAEEALFYNSLRSIAQTKDTVREAYSEHLEAEVLLRTIQIKDQFGIPWKDSAARLRKALAHHIDEEEVQVFPIAKQLFTQQEADMMGEAFARLKPEVKTEGLMKTSLELVANVMPPRFARALGGLNLENRV